MKKYVLASLLAILATSCSSQEKNKQDLAQENRKISKTDPKGSWKVDREVDENGNLIKYDSIYSWSSSNGSENLSPESLDSITERFGSMFGRDFSLENGFQGFSENDSLFMKQFFNGRSFDDPMFLDHFGGNRQNLDEIMKQMDSLQSLFLDKHRLQPIVPSEEESHKQEKF